MASSSWGHAPRPGRDPEAELQRLKGRFRAVSRKFERRMALRRSYKWAALTVAGAVVAGGLYGVLMSRSPWPQVTTLKHIVAFPNCAAARVVDLAPARIGQPGYYRWHDADRDGVACEPWRRPTGPGHLVLR